MNVKYRVVPGFVRSSDGDVHYISSEKLIKLYGVNPKECVIDTGYEDQARNYYRWKKLKLIYLTPRPDGNYDCLENQGRDPDLSNKILDEIASLRDRLKAARKNRRCRCSGFVLQYEGSCQCGSEREVDDLESKLQGIINSL